MRCVFNYDVKVIRFYDDGFNGHWISCITHDWSSNSNVYKLILMMFLIYIRVNNNLKEIFCLNSSIDAESGLENKIVETNCDPCSCTIAVQTDDPCKYAFYYV